MSHRGHQTPGIPNAAQPVVIHSPTWQPPRPISRTSSGTRGQLPIASSNGSTKKNTSGGKTLPLGEEDFGDLVSDDDNDYDHEMGDRRPPLHRPTDGRSHQPLLHKDDEDRGRTGYDSPNIPPERPVFSRRSTMRSRSPDTQAKLATRKKYTYAAFFLGLSLISFVVQTETAVYIQHELGWNKAYCML